MSILLASQFSHLKFFILIFSLLYINYAHIFHSLNCLFLSSLFSSLVYFCLSFPGNKCLIMLIFSVFFFLLLTCFLMVLTSIIILIVSFLLLSFLVDTLYINYALLFCNVLLPCCPILTFCTVFVLISCLTP